VACLLGKKISVTGGTGTLALECGKALLEHGLSGLALLDINPAPTFSAFQDEFPDRKIVVHRCDVTSAADLERVMKTVEQELGSIDILCCFAGVVGCVPSLSMTPEEWRRTLDINTTGAFLSAQAAGRVMRERGNGGSIVFIASMSAHRVNFPQPQAAYNASKAALLHLSHSLAAEWAVYGIRVNTISPGYMDTILNEGAGLEKARRIWQERTPMGRMGAPQELTGPLVLMCSRFAGAYVTGTDLVVDGTFVLAGSGSIKTDYYPFCFAGGQTVF